MTAQHTELIAQLTAIGIPDWATARHLMVEAADAIEALEAQAETLRYEFDVVAAIKAERDALQAQLAATQGQEPVGYLLPTTVKFVHAGTVMAGHAGANWVKLYAEPIPQSAEPAQGVPEGYAPLTIDEIEALTAMVYGAPWKRNHCEGLLDVLVMYEELRFAGKRPVDPIDMTKAERRAHFKNAAAPQPKEPT